MIPRFGRPVPQLCMTSNHIMDFIYTNWNYLLSDMTQPCLSSANLEALANSIHQSGAAFDNCWGFVDGTVRPVCRPGRNQ